MAASKTRNIPKDPRETPLSLFLWGSEKFERRKSILKAFRETLIFDKTAVILPSISRKDAWTRAAFQARELIRLKLAGNWSHAQFLDAVRETDNFLPVQPQSRIFLSNLERQASDEQKAEWLPKAERFEICKQSPFAKHFLWVCRLSLHPKISLHAILPPPHLQV